MNSPDQQSDRITELELQLMHLQKDFETVNEVVLENSRRLDEILTMMKRLTQKIESQQASPEVRDPLDEKPPHY